MNRISTYSVGAVLSAALVALAAPPAAAEDETLRHTDHLVTPIGMSLTVGGGVTGLADSDSRDMVNTGGTWEARLTFGTRTPIAGEVAYVGTAQGLDMPMADDPVLLGNGVEGVARLNFGNYDIQPYGLGGLGWTHYSIVDDTPEMGLRDDDVATVPVGGGIAFQAFGALIDVRGVYRFAFDDNLTEGDDDFDIDERDELDNWSAIARAGFEF